MVKPRASYPSQDNTQGSDSPAGMLERPFRALNDPEGDRVPDALPPIVDAHVHLFPDHIFSSVWKWFDRYGWPVRYRLTSQEIIQLIEKYENLWLDTTMALANYLPMEYFPKIAEMRTDRVMFGTDFPNLPYAWDRELRRLAGLNLADKIQAKVLGENAVEFYAIKRD